MSVVILASGEMNLWNSGADDVARNARLPHPACCSSIVRTDTALQSTATAADSASSAPLDWCRIIDEQAASSASRTHCAELAVRVRHHLRHHSAFFD